MASNSLIGELIHFHAITLRVKGNGNLKSTLYSLDKVNSSNLINLLMVNSTNRQPTLLANFIEQRAQYQIKTTELDERFEISKMVIFVKPVATSFPQ